MVTLTLMGRDFEIAPYALGAMRKAAPLVDKINASVGGLSTLEGGVAVLDDLVAFVAIGIARVDPTITREVLDDEVGLADLPVLQEAFRAILVASGMKLGEAKAPLASAETAAASNEASAPSSSSSSQPA